MTTVNGSAPYVRDWMAFELGSDFMKPTNALSKDQKELVKKMMSPKKFTSVINGLQTRWNKFEELQKVAVVLWGHVAYTPLLFFHPKQQAGVVEATYNAILAERLNEPALMPNLMLAPSV